VSFRLFRLNFQQVVKFSDVMDSLINRWSSASPSPSRAAT